MNALVVVAGLGAWWYLRTRSAATADAPVAALAPSPELNPANPANAAEVSRAYEGYPASTPVVFMDANGQVRETTTGQLQQDFLALAQMQDTSFLPRPEDAPRDHNGTNMLPVPLTQYERDYAPPPRTDPGQFYHI